MRHLILLTFLLVSASGVCINAGAADIVLTFDTNVETATPSVEGLTNKATFAAGKEVPVSSEKLVWIEAKGRVPVLVVPAKEIQSPSGSPKLKLPEVAAWPPQMIDTEIERRMSLLIDDLQAFQVAMGRRDLKESELILNRMESTQPMTYLAFLRASLDFLKGNFASSRTNVEKGLKKYPGNVQGQKLLKALEENKR